MKLLTKLTKIILILYPITFLFTSSAFVMFPTVAIPTLIFHYIALCVLFPMALVGIIKSPRLSLSALLIWLSVLCMVLVSIPYFSEISTWLGTPWRTGGLFFFLGLACYATVLEKFFVKKDYSRLFAVWSYVIAIISLINVLLSPFVLPELGRMSILAGNPIYLAVFNFFALFISLKAIFESDFTFGISKRLHYSFFFLSIVSLILTFTKSIVLGLVFGLFFVSFLNFKYLKMKHVWWIVLLVMIFLASLIPRFMQFHFRQEPRFVVWKIALEEFIKSPYGHGVERFLPFYQLLPIEGDKAWVVEREKTFFDRSHNQFIDYLYTGGFVLFLLFCFLYLRFYKLAPVYLRVFLLAYLFHLFFFFDVLQSYLLFVLFLIFLEYGTRENCAVRKVVRNI